MDLEKVTYQQEGNIAIITINNPPANTLGRKTLADLNQAIHKADSDNTVKAVVISGEGKMFVAGADLKEINNITSQKEGEDTALFGQELFNKMELMKKPIIAAINGACLGGGMELAMACHIRLAAENAKFGQPEINLGLIPGFGGTQRLPRITNKGIALEWILTGDMYSAKEAYDLGLVNKVYSLELLLEEAKKMAHKIASKGLPAIKMTMEAIEGGLKTTLEDGLKLEAKLFGDVCMTEDKKEGVQAFLEKRPPIFNDR